MTLFALAARPTPAATISEHFNAYGASSTTLIGLGAAGQGWSGAWSGNTGPQYAPGRSLAYFAPGYSNVGNPYGSADGAVRQGGDPSVGNPANRNLSPALGLEGVNWVSALFHLEGSPPGGAGAGAALHLDASRVIGNVEAGLYFASADSLGVRIVYDNLSKHDDSSSARFAASQTHLLLLRLAIGLTDTSFAVWVDPDLTQGEAGLPAPIYDVTAPTNRMVGSSLQDIGVGFFGQGPTDGRLVDAIRVSNDSDGFLNVTALPQLLGDADFDCEVGAADYALWAAQFGQTGVGLSADFDGSGSVGAADYALWAANFGKTCPPPASARVPEPSAAALAGVSMVVLAAARARNGRRDRR